MSRTASIGEARRRLPREFLRTLDASFPQGITERILRGMGAARPTTLRVNTLRSNAAEIMRFLKARAVRNKRVQWYPDAFQLEGSCERDAQEWELYTGGKIYLQSLSSMIPPLALAPQPGQRVLDIAAAPGSKTTQMAALMENRGYIMANELDEVRAQRLAYNIRVQGCEIVEVAVGRGEKLGEQMPDSFDRVLIDVPCSGEGRFIVFEPASSRHWSPRAVVESVRVQKKLLASGVCALKPGGSLVYSTCTLNLDENERMIDWALRELPVETEKIPIVVPGSFAGLTRGFSAGLERALRIFPDPVMEGFFICRLRKKG